MAENAKFYTRVQLKFDTWDNWQKVPNTFQPLKGEVCIVKVPGTGISDLEHQDATSVTKPAYLIKVGDGDTSFHDLPWLSAKAADVHQWAKKSETEFKAWLVESIEKGGVALATAAQLNEVDGKVNTLNQTVEGINSALGVVENAIGVPVNYDASKDGTAFSRIDAIENKLGMDETDGGSISDRVETLEGFVGVPASGEGDDAVVASGLHAAVATAQSTANEVVAKVKTLVGKEDSEDATRSVREIAKDTIAKYAAPGVVDSAINTLTEVLNWIQDVDDNHAGAAALIEDVSAIQSFLGGENASGGYDALSAGTTVRAAVDSNTQAIGDINDKLNGIPSGDGTVVKEIENAINAVVGTDGDATTANTIYGAKAYADSIVEDATDALIGADGNEATANTIHGAKAYAKGYADELAGGILDRPFVEVESNGPASYSSIKDYEAAVKNGSANGNDLNYVVFYCGTASIMTL